ncbi:hypothetical protein MAR_ORF351 [Marseillevirus marseillevirus]|uniref:Uncharacterized protein n=1 Tax=Marseillevirus marseillevirus TaxID=694581 RepID=D2XAZ0_GBMV|nr:hypothetical protein MAR_ORF351 [Marseillevirus marseillevirus]ADB04117.1 hypothetical protein MAR_ORF351 [Marseillevirus marseillevirus]
MLSTQKTRNFRGGREIWEGCKIFFWNILSKSRGQTQKADCERGSESGQRVFVVFCVERGDLSRDREKVIGKDHLLWAKVDGLRVFQNLKSGTVTKSLVHLFCEICEGIVSSRKHSTKNFRLQKETFVFCIESGTRPNRDEPSLSCVVLFSSTDRDEKSGGSCTYKKRWLDALHKAMNNVYRL